MTAYVALLRKRPDTDCGVDFPDFPGCVTAARTLEEARLMAAEALDLHVSGLAEDGVALPAPASLDAILADARHANVTAVVIVDAPSRAPRHIRVNLTLPEDIVEQIDGVTDNRSRFLAEAAREKLLTTHDLT